MIKRVCDKVETAPDLMEEVTPVLNKKQQLKKWRGTPDAVGLLALAQPSWCCQLESESVDTNEILSSKHRKNLLKER